jgi:hypothetical protein
MGWWHVHALHVCRLCRFVSCPLVSREAQHFAVLILCTATMIATMVLCIAGQKCSFNSRLSVHPSLLRAVLPH